MRNLLLILLLANILYFMWGMLGKDSSEPGVDVIRETDLGPPLTVSNNRDNEAAASIAAVLASGEPSALEAVFGRSCVSIGPFKSKEDADAALTQYAGEGMRTDMRSMHGTIFVGHWVQIRNIADRLTGDEMLEQLHAGGLSDAYLVNDEEEGLSISLGLFGDLERAEKVELDATAMDLPVSVVPRTREGTIFFADIALSPGKGAGAIIDKYGEDRVRLRDAATCPL